MAATMATTMATMLAAGEMVRDTTSPSAVNADVAYQALLDPLRQIARADAPAQAAPPQPLSGSPSDPGVMIPPWPTPGAAPPAAGRAGSPNGGTWQQAGVVHFGRPPHFPAAHVLGETAMPDVPGSDRYVYPELRIDTSRAADGSGRATVRPTQARDAVHPSFAFGPGGYRVGPQEVQIGDRARTETFTAALIVDSTISERARAAEQEHLDDMVVAYQLSLERAAAAVNAAAGQPFSGPTEADAEAAARTTVASQLPPRLGVTPAAWRDANLALARLSRRRDEQQTHSFIAPLESYDLRARVVLFRAMEGPHTRLIGTLRPEQLVRLEALPPASTGSPAAGAHSRLSGPSADRDPLRPRCSACAGGAGPCASCDR
jgi:hypothetical protein